MARGAALVNLRFCEKQLQQRSLVLAGPDSKSRSYEMVLPDVRNRQIGAVPCLASWAHGMVLAAPPEPLANLRVS